jgi:hypothetical protein
MSRADDDYEDDRPRRPRRPRDDDDYEDDDDRPRRRGKAGGGSGGGGSALIILLVVGGGALLLCIPVAIALLLPAVQKVREAAARAQDMNNYKQVAIGFHNHNDAKTRLPAADGNLSWRVALLPYVEEQGLYAQFDQAQGWDAAKNRPLADTPVKTYVSPLDGGENKAFTQTHIRVFTGPDTLFPPAGTKLRFPVDVTDGLSNTILAVEATETVPWPQPRELAFVKGGPLPALGHPNRQTGFIVAMGDGSVRFVKKPANDTSIRAAITAAGNDGPPDF